MNRYSIQIVFIVFLFSVLFSACNLRKEVTDVWNYVQERPDSALLVLNSLPENKYRGRTLAEYRLLKAMAMDNSNIIMSSDSLARPALDFFHKYGPRNKELVSLYYLGLSQYYAKDFNSSVLSLERVCDLARKCNNEQYDALSRFYLSHIYFSRYSYKEAVTYARECLPFFLSLSDSSFQTRWAMLHLADCYVGNSQFQEANAIYTSLIEKHLSDSVLLRQALPHYAWSLFLSDAQNNYTSLKVYQEAQKYYNASLGWQDLHHYGVVLLSVGEEEKALKVINQLDGCYEFPDLAHDLRYRLLKMRGEYDEAFKEYEIRDLVQDKVVLETFNSSLYQRLLANKEKELENALLKLEVVRGYSLVACVGVILLVAIMLLLVWRKRINEEKEQLVSSVEEATESVSQLQLQNSALSKELEGVRQKYVAAYKKQFQKIASLVEYYRTTSGKMDGRDLVYKQVMELSSTVGKDRMSMRALERNVNTALDNAMSRYRETFPGKSQEHYDLVCYFMAGFPASLIELLTGIPKNTLYSKKSRLLDELADSHSPHKDLLYRSIK